MRHAITLGLVLPALLASASLLYAEDSKTQPAAKNTTHVLHKLLEVASKREKEIRETVRDYTCTIVKRERIDGSLQSRRYIRAKVRPAGVHDGHKLPLSVHLTFLKPKQVAGREVIFIDGQNKGQMIVKRGGRRFGNVTVNVDPDGELSHTESLMHIGHMGLDGMVSEIVAHVRQDIKADPTSSNTELHLSRDSAINGRKCTSVVIIHPNRADNLEFYRAEFFIDNENHLPVRVAAYDWPKEEGADPELIAEFTYTKVKINVGLKDSDFDVAQLLRTASR